MVNLLFLLNNMECMAKRGNYALCIPELTEDEKQTFIAKGFSIENGRIKWDNPIPNTLSQRWNDMARIANETPKPVKEEPIVIQCYL